MKIRNLILSVLAGAAALFTSCMPEEPVIKTLDGIELGSSYITIAKGQTSASTTMKINDSWTSEVPEWLTLDPASGAAGDYTLQFIAKADTLDQGEVNIIFSGKTQKIIVIRDGEKPKPAGVLFEEPFIGHGQGDFEIKDVVGNPWTYDPKYGMKASAYVNNAYTDADSYLISPEIDLAGESVALLTFEDAVNYMNGFAVVDYLSVEVTTDNGASWEKVEVPNWPAGSGWDFVRSGDVDLSKFCGKKIKFAFHYTSTTKASPTWEIMNVKVSNVAGAVPPELKVEPTSVTLPADDGASAEIKVTTDGELTVSGPFSDAECKEAESDPWVSIAASEGGYTVTASANEGDARSAYFKFESSNANGSVDAVLQVSQAAKPGAKGSLPSNPYTVAEIIAALKEGEVAGNVYVKGIISNTTKYNYGPTFSTASFWISDDGVYADDLDKDFEAYSIYWLGGSLEAPTAAADIKANFVIGDEVVLYGAVTAFTKDGKTTYETASKKAKIYSLNWAQTDENGVGNLDYPFNNAGAKQFIIDTQAAVKAAKDNGETLALPNVAVAGKVSKIVFAFNSEKHTGTFWMSGDGVFADDLEKDFEAYGVKWLENKDWEEGYGQVAEGDEVVVLGQLTAYTKDGKTTYETASKKAYLYSLNGKTKMDDTPQPEETPKLYLNEFFPKEKKIEIYNAEDEDIDMTGWVLLKNDGEEGEKDTFTIPATLAQIPAKGYAVFTCKQKDAANGPLFGLSGDKGFKIALKKGDTVIDEVNNLKEKDVALIVIPDGNSWGRETDGAADFVLFETPTIGAANTGAPEKPAPATIAEIVAAIPASANSSGAAVTIEAKLAAPAVVSYVNGRNAYIQDETGAILLYLDGHGLQPGDSILGEISVTACWFNGNPELTSLNILGEKTGGDAPQPKVITLAELLANFDANHLRLVKLMDVTVTDGIADGDRNGKISQGADEIAVYAQLNNKGLLLNQGDTGSLVTIPGKYNEKQQLYFWQNDWFSKQEEPAASGIKIDGDMSDWAMVMSTSNPNEDPAYAEFKVASDENNIYFYVRRTAKKFNDIWDGGGYVYFAFDTDNDSTTGTGEIFGNGPYETIFFIRPFAGNSSAPAFAEKPLSDSQIAPSGSLANYVGNGVFNAETGVELEFSIPRADLPAIPAGQEITIYSWGNKSGENMKDAPLKIAL